MRLVLAVLLAGTGCAQVWGIDQTSSGADAGMIAEPASVQMQRVSIGAAVTRSPLNLTGQMATFYDDAAGALAPVTGVLDGTDRFTADVAGTPSVSVTLPEMAPQRLLATPARAQRGKLVRFENPAALPPLPSSSLMLNLTLPTAYVSGEQFTIQAIGPWTEHGLTSTELPAPDVGATTITANPNYAIFTGMFDGITIEATDPVRISASDVVLVLRYQGTFLSGVYQTQFEQTDAPDALSGPMIAVPQTSTLEVTANEADYMTRFAAVRPSVANMTRNWTVNAAPGWSVGDATGVRLLSGVGPLGPLYMFGNPFESLDWKSVFFYTTFAQRQYAFTDGMNTFNIPLRATLTTVTEPTAALMLAMPAGLPITIEANSTALVTDGQTLPLDLTAPVVVEATLDRGTNTAYRLDVVEVAIEPAGTGFRLARTVIMVAHTTGSAQFRLPPSLFAVDKSYYFSFTAYQGGLVNAATGDLQTLSLPYSTGSLDSAVFTVGMP